mgnify:CR=1 FL=1
MARLLRQTPHYAGLFEKFRGLDRIGDKAGRVRMDHDPGDVIPLRDGQLVLASAPTVE